MKILITSITYPGTVGVSTYIDQLINGLKNQGHHVDLFQYNPFSKQPGRQNNRVSTNQNQIAAYQAAAARLPFHSYDIIHSQGIIPTIAVSRIKPKHLPLVMSLHGALTFNMLINGVITKNMTSWQQRLEAESRAVSLSDICIVGSQWLKNVLLHDYKVVQNQTFSIVPYGINIEDFVNKMGLSSSITTPENKFILACTARLVPLKGHQYLIQALAKLKQYRQDWVCWLIGEGPLRNQLQQQANRLGLSSYVKFLGNQNNVASLLKEVDLFVFPSLQDNMPYAVMEAQLAGVPAVVTDAGGIPEMVHHGVTGLISPKKNSHALFENMKIMTDNVELRESLVSNARSWAQVNWSLEKMINSTIEVYNQAIQMKT